MIVARIDETGDAVLEQLCGGERGGNPVAGLAARAQRIGLACAPKREPEPKENKNRGGDC